MRSKRHSSGSKALEHRPAAHRKCQPIEQMIASWPLPQSSSSGGSFANK
jgi:hypothetical protein